MFWFLVLPDRPDILEVNYRNYLGIKERKMIWCWLELRVTKKSQSRVNREHYRDCKIKTQNLNNSSAMEDSPVSPTRLTYGWIYCKNSGTAPACCRGSRVIAISPGRNRGRYVPPRWDVPRWRYVPLGVVESRLVFACLLRRCSRPVSQRFCLQEKRAIIIKFFQFRFVSYQ